MESAEVYLQPDLMWSLGMDGNTELSWYEARRLDFYPISASHWLWQGSRPGIFGGDDSCQSREIVLHVGPQTSRMSIPWELVRPTESETAGVGSNSVRFNKLLRWFWDTLKWRTAGLGQLSWRESCEPLAADPHIVTGSTALWRESEWTPNSTHDRIQMLPLYSSKSPLLDESCF